MEVEANQVIGKTIKSNMCFVLIDRDKAICDDVEKYVIKPEDDKFKDKNDHDVSDPSKFVKDIAYRVNAAFAACVTIAESGGGKSWDAIDPSTYNWFSIKGSYNGQSQGGWRKYPSFAAAVDDFGDLIANGKYYYKAGKRTVNEIGPTYCNAHWSDTVNSLMQTALDKAN